jgi:pyridoxamine 5'-phosphate oxidase
MNFKDYIEFANANPICFFATADGNQPRVRPLGMWFADAKGFVFQTETVKAIYKQLKNNNSVEICFHGKEGTPSAGKVMRVAGKVKFLDDLTLKKKVLEERAFLKSYGFEKPEDPRLVVFSVYKGEAYFWTMADNMKESEIKRLKFGK